MNKVLDSILYLFFYFYPILILIIGNRLRINFNYFPIPIKLVDLLTPYLLISVFIQSDLAGFKNLHFYFYIILSIIGILHASYLAFQKRTLFVGQFFRMWWRYVFILAFLAHFIIGGYGIYIRFA